MTARRLLMERTVAPPVPDASAVPGHSTRGRTARMLLLAGSVLLLFKMCPAGYEGEPDASTLLSESQAVEWLPRFSIVSFGTLAGFPYAADGGMIPQRVRELDGTRVAVSGFMLPVRYDNGVQEFLLNANLDMCYFGAPTLPHQFVVVTMTGGRGTPVVHTPVDVYGTLHVKEERRGDRIVSLYRMQGEAIYVRPEYR